ncbi:SDR family NAD(P)-dependent oxidoreductase [Clostridium sp. AF18-27]|uniref:SDR family oxidoreductase n=1 Tax=Enterocloster lavalensis TaxID=460384 RepID=UPI000E472F02|nr:SDR family oxidoreductase [Enterocloster lavalensis]RHR54037.1 SDR family NAD(P)-dependent oxidoreductase [Clostridium sp. AF18-27]
MISKFSLEHKTAIVTGGAKGLCYSMAEALHEAGAVVVLVDVLDLVEESAARLGACGAPVYAVKADLSDTARLREACGESVALLGGRVDILLNGAGIQYRCPAEDFPEDRWRRILDINLSAVFFMSQEIGKQMLKQGRGKIINVASMTSFMASVMIPAYAASKAGVAQITKALSNEWAGKGICVNAIAPGYMNTELTRDMKLVNPTQYEEISGRIPMGRWGEPEDLKGVVVFLASEASDYISGIVVPVDGGYLGK